MPVASLHHGGRPVCTRLRTARPLPNGTIAGRISKRSWRSFGRAGVVVALGGFAFDQVLRILQRSSAGVPRPRPKFSHGVEVDLGSRTVLGCYHPSQQNTFTGRLTESMFDAVWERARSLISP